MSASAVSRSGDHDVLMLLIDFEQIKLLRLRCRLKCLSQGVPLVPSQQGRSWSQRNPEAGRKVAINLTPRGTMKIRLAALSSLAVAAAQSLVLLFIAPIGRAQTVDPANPPPDQPAAANT